MRIAIASYGQETSSFSALPTTLDTFRLYGLYEGAEILQKCQGIGSVGGFLEVAAAEAPDWELVPIVHGWAGAHGPLTDDTLAFFVERVVAGLRAAGPLDGVYLALHGAAVADSEPDTEGYMLEEARRAVGPDTPLVISLDHHANLTERMVANCDALVGHRTQPHDQHETGVLAARLLLPLVRGEIRPRMAWRKLPLITHQEQFLTKAGPMKAWFDLARAMEGRPGVLAASPFPMQPWLDVPEGGWALAVVTDNDEGLAEALADELAEDAWARRADFCRMDSVPPAEAVGRALAAPEGLVVLTDTGDSIWGGATGDSVTILTEMVQQEIDQTALVSVIDPEAVAAAVAAGEGNEVDLVLGGKLDRTFGRPLAVRARVAGVGGGRFVVPLLGFESFEVGRAVLLEIGAIKVFVSEERGVGGNHPAVYEHFGVDVGAAKMVVVKTASNWQFFNRWVKQMVRVDTPGATMSRLEDFDWKQLPRPIYPLDAVEGWR